jgi:hypothetical protein
MFRPGDPVGSLKRASVIWQSHHDTGKLELVVASPESAVIRLVGFALPSREICGTIKGWIREHIATAGGRDVMVVKSQCVVKGDPECRFEATWSMPVVYGAAAG